MSDAAFCLLSRAHSHCSIESINFLLQRRCICSPPPFGVMIARVSRLRLADGDYTDESLDTLLYDTAITPKNSPDALPSLLPSKRSVSSSLPEPTEFENAFRAIKMKHLRDGLTDDTPTMILPSIHIGSALAAANVYYLKQQLRVSHILSLGSKPRILGPFIYHRIKVAANTKEKTPKPSSSSSSKTTLPPPATMTTTMAARKKRQSMRHINSEFAEANSFISSALSHPDNVLLIHSRNGRNRCATILLAYLSTIYLASPHLLHPLLIPIRQFVVPSDEPLWIGHMLQFIQKQATQVTLNHETYQQLMAYETKHNKQHQSSCNICQLQPTITSSAASADEDGSATEDLAGALQNVDDNKNDRIHKGERDNDDDDADAADDDDG